MTLNFRGFATILPALGLALGLALTLPVQASENRSVTGHLPQRAATTPPEGASALCGTYGWACDRTKAPVTVDAAMLEMVEAVNRRINRSVAPVSDLAQYGTAERWTLPTRRGGDCEDYALAKKQALIGAGIAPQQLLLTTVLDRQQRSHAVLILRTGRQDLVLDNMTDRIKPWQQTGYSFLRMQNPARPAGWVAVLAGGVFDGKAPVAQF